MGIKTEKIVDLLRKKLHLSPAAGLALGLTAVFIAAIFFIRQYAVSYDEFLLYDFAEYNVQAYQKMIAGLPYEHLLEYYDLRYYGPAYLILGNLFAHFFLRVLPGYTLYNAWHLVNFGLFLLGGWLIFCLIRRVTAPRQAVWGALLFLTQPLLWGHGIMNPKDSAFLVFFLAAVLAGMRVVDAAQAAAPPVSVSRLAGVRTWIKQHWPRRAGLALGIFCAVTMLDRSGPGLFSRPLVTAVFNHLAAAPRGTLGGFLFKRVAANASQIQPGDYINKACEILARAEFWVLLAVAAAGLLWWLSGTTEQRRRAVTAGMLVGLASAVRILGPAAAGVIVVYAWRKKIPDRLALLGLYLGSALAAMLMIWPYLWSAPISRFLECLRVMAQFPWPGSVRFAGQDYLASNLPWYYLPELIGLQLTLPLLILAIIGLGCAIQQRRLKTGEWLALAAWFFLPLAAVMLVRPNMYDNFRQFLFILPPLFVFAAFGLERLTRRWRRQWSLALMGLCLLPGLAAGAYLHPYEYVYYNALAGWSGNIERRYEADYWGTAVCEAAEYLNDTAADGAVVALTDGILRQIFDTCAVPGKFDVRLTENEAADWQPQYAVLLTRYDNDQDYFRSLPIIAQFGRGKTDFVVIRGGS